MGLLSDSSYHFQFEQTALNRQTDRQTAQIQPLLIFIQPVLATHKFLIMKSFQSGRGKLKKIYPLNMDFPRNPFDGDSPYSFNDLFARVCDSAGHLTLSYCKASSY